MKAAALAAAGLLLTSCGSSSVSPTSTAAAAGAGYKYSEYGISMWHPGGLMVSQTTGWSGGGLLSRTTDGGASWVKVLPSSLDSTFDILQSEYLDATHAWAIQHLPDQGEVVVFRTQDGGASWERGEPITRSGADWPVQLDFVDPLHGWMLVSEGTSYRAPEDFRLYGTRDGGLHWQREAMSSAATPASSGTYACVQWCLMSFASMTTGAMTSLDPVAGAGGLSLLLTQDGGVTWTRHRVAAPSAALRCPCYVDKPIFQDARHGFLLIWSGTPPLSGRLLVTADGGTTWSSRPLPGEAQFGVGFIGVGFADPMQGWAIAGPVSLFSHLDVSLTQTVALPLYRTSDGGRTWGRVLTGLALRSPGGRVAIYFLDRDVGFAVRTGSSGVQLLRSTDGGHSWQTAGASLPGGPP